MGKAIFASHWDWHDYMVVVFAYSRDNSPQFVFEGVITLVFTVAVLWMVFCKDENFVVVRDMAISKVKTFLYNRC